jgi:hypothetical protein
MAIEAKGKIVALQLAEVVANLREELLEAMRAAEGQPLQFELGTVELELTVAVEKEAKPGAKVKFWVLEVGTEARLASTNTQKLKIRLEPVDPARGGRAPRISGESLPDER